MLSKNKLEAIRIFAHSRLSGKYITDVTEDDNEDRRAIEDKEKHDMVGDKIKSIVSILEDQGYTVEHLNNRIDGSRASSIVTADAVYKIAFYYETLLNAYRKELTLGDTVIEAVLAICLLSQVYDATEVDNDLGVDLMELSSHFELSDKVSRGIAFDMYRIGQAMLDKLDSVKYKTPIVKRVSKTRKKKRRR